MNSVLRRPDWFVAFDEYRAVRIYERNLPHWRQEGCTYFVTFRLADSIPVGVRREWEQEKARWLERLGIAYDGERGSWRATFRELPPRDQFRFEQHFNRQVQSCLDRGLGECHLREGSCTSAVRDQLFRHDGRRYHLGDFVIMPNHAHLLLTPVIEPGGEDGGDDEEDGCKRAQRNEFDATTAPMPKLELILKSIKGASAVACNRIRYRTGAFWQADSFDHIVRSMEQLLAYREYIARNPILAGLELPPEATHRADWMDAWHGGPS